MPQRHLFPQSLSSPPLVAVLLALALAGCDAQREISAYRLRESPEAANAPWPRLVDGPTHVNPPGPGPDTAAGEALAAELIEIARGQAAEAERLSGPVLAIAPLRAEGAAVRAGRP